MTKHPDVAEVIGGNAKRIRKTAGLTLDDVAIAARARGLRWTESRVADFEAGRVSPGLPTLLAFLLTLTDAGCGDVTFPDLVASKTAIEINGAVTVLGDDLAAIMGGAPPRAHQSEGSAIGPIQIRVKVGEHDYLTRDAYAAYQKQLRRFELRTQESTVEKVARASGSAEDRVRQALRISPQLLVVASAALWERSFSQERDARAGEGANPQKRGQVTRQLRQELAAELDDGDN